MLKQPLNSSHNYNHAELKPSPRYRDLSPLAKTVLQHMRRAGSISARDAMVDHGISSASLARRICDLEEAGYVVVRDRRVHPLTTQRYTRYSLAED
jgi:DNA-binding HxlR family transcriptional regulator